MKYLLSAAAIVIICFSLPLYSQAPLPSTDDTLFEINEVSRNGDRLALDVKIQNTIPLAAADVVLKIDKNMVTSVESDPVTTLQPCFHSAVLKTHNPDYDFLHLSYAHIYKSDSTFQQGEQLPVNTGSFTLWRIVLTLADTSENINVLESYALAADSTTAASVVPVTYHSSVLTSANSTASFIPSAFSLEQNYPNPFNAGTTICFDLPAGAFVKLDVFNAAGQWVQTPANGFFPAGQHQVNFTRSSLPSGVYFYRLQTGPQKGQITHNFIHRMVLAK